MINAQLTLIETTDELLDFREWLGGPHHGDRVAFDLETSGFNLGRDRVRLGQIGDRDRGWAFPCEGPRSWYGAFGEALQDYEGRLFAHNLIFDWSFLTRDGIAIPTRRVEDTMVMAQLHQSNYAIALKSVGSRIVDRQVAALQKLLDMAMSKQGWDWGTVPIDFPPYWQYGALDPVLTCRIAEKLEPLVLPEFQYAYDVEIAAIEVLRNAQLAGMPIDLEYATRMSRELGEELEALEPNLPCKPESTKEVPEWLLSRGAVLTKKTESGKNWSTDDEVLKYWAANGIPECEIILDYRQARKLKTNYFDNLLVREVGGVVHPSIRVLGASKTGRMSITEPALQTLPRSAVGRNAFVAREGCTLLAPDFSGIEMRLLAHAADEKTMKKLYAEGVDLHRWTAQHAYRTEEPTKKQRQVAKNAGFAKVFCAGIETFAGTARISLDAATDFMQTYDELFPGVEAFHHTVTREVNAGRGRKWGSIRTELGRRLYVEKEKAYKGVNYRIQGTAGQVLKVKLAELDAAGLGDFIRLPIHDEIVMEVPDELVPEAIQTIETVMPEREMFSVPLEVETKGAKRWGHLYLDDGEEPYLAPGEQVEAFGS